MKAFQLAIAGLVMASNIRYRWTPNPYLAAVYGGMAAFAATWLIVEGLARLRIRLKAFRLSHQPPRNS